ncbi:hypothetical protein DVU_2777 [Nitratidesulfovibrio vulgaris str. Hildenborough]|uniref:Uncharacterized protein n=1 Tax=Nitratidesulfovibrio vulgaris (strain ATCC 29579 / DSM 644 / CCUG 34227 / NCIMB 8303 / VKM B-1760 / Hildenborough) TaxID=882 RepID=Q727S8_NITV2|nr:hypothetical protein DVU_2777 [Nitratidesulfovibrio vulgaris str. Hildenborough]
MSFIWRFAPDVRVTGHAVAERADFSMEMSVHSGGKAQCTARDSNAFQSNTLKGRGWLPCTVHGRCDGAVGKGAAQWDSDAMDDAGRCS